MKLLHFTSQKKGQYLCQKPALSSNRGLCPRSRNNSRWIDCQPDVLSSVRRLLNCEYFLYGNCHLCKFRDTRFEQANRAPPVTQQCLRLEDRKPMETIGSVRL